MQATHSENEDEWHDSSVTSPSDHVLSNIAYNNLFDHLSIQNTQDLHLLAVCGFLHYE